MKLFILVLLASLSYQTNLHAENDVKEIYAKKTVIDFNEVNIEGELTRPEGSYLMNRKRAKFNKLYKVRGNFRSEVIKSTDNL